jgi:hypothetical protein
MSLRKTFRPLKELGHRFVGGRHKPDRTGADITGERDYSTDLPPQPESGVIEKDEHGQGGNEADGDEGEGGSLGSPLQPDDLDVTPADGRGRKFGRSRIDVDEGEAGSMDLPLQPGGEEVPGSRHSREGNETVVDREVGPVDLSSQPNLGISGDRESSGSM